MMKSKGICFVIFVCILFYVGGCKGNQRDKCSASMRAVFSDFAYAGSIHELKELNTVSVGNSISLPNEFRPGEKYVFYHRRIPSSYEFESKTIPSRLMAQGIPFKPLEQSDFGYPNEGGPLFSMEMLGACKGRIYNVVDRRITQDKNLSQTWATEAYILEFGGRVD